MFKNKKIAVIGAGVEGVSSARFLEKKGALVTVLDQRREADSGSSTRMTINFKLGKDYLKGLEQYDILVRSPGAKRDLPELAQAEKNGVEITSQTKIFFDLCPCPIIGVTGTKGKGTTSSLIYEMLKKESFDVYLGGNIGQPPLDFLDKLSEHSTMVLELSSSQLLDLKKSPFIAVVLMIVPEHLNYHQDMEEYVEAKRNILKYQTATDFAILNRDYPVSRESDVYTGAKVFYVSREGEVKQGCFVKDGKIVIRFAARSTGTTPRAHEEIIETEIADAKDILLLGKHNLENVCAAVMAATLSGVSKKSIVSVLKTFRGLKHRLELVGEIGGVRYYDDSFSTTPETAIAAILAFKNPEILILGGSSKNSDFTELGRVIRGSENIKAIIGMGSEWERIKAQFKVHPFDELRTKFKVIEGCKDMGEIVQQAAKAAEAGDVVLLTPACASFDMFKNYKERGEQFKKEVQNLASRMPHVSRDARKT